MLTCDEYKEIYVAISSIFGGDYCPEEDYLDRDDFEDDNEYENAVAIMMMTNPDYFKTYFEGAQDIFEDFLDSACLTKEKFKEVFEKETKVLEKYNFF